MRRTSWDVNFLSLPPFLSIRCHRYPKIRWTQQPWCTGRLVEVKESDLGKGCEEGSWFQGVKN